MSSMTRPELDRSITCGFYDSLPGDQYPRKYFASQMSRLFDGLINDGIFASIGEGLVVKKGDGNTITVGTGKCWFNHTWTENDSPYIIDCGESTPNLHRIDAIVVKIDTTEEIRDNFIEFKMGTPSSEPERPILETGENGVYEYALCYIYREADSDSFTQSDITDVRVTETPFVTGIVDILKLDNVILQWQAELNEWIANNEAEITAWRNEQRADFDAWYLEMKTLVGDVIDEVDEWQKDQKASVLAWFDEVRDQLSTDAALNLQFQIDKAEIENILMWGLPEGVKTYSDDDSVVTTIDSTGRKLTKTFSNEFLTCVIVLTDAKGGELGRLTKNISPDGKTITSVIDVYVPDPIEYIEPALDEVIELQNSYIDK